MKKQPKDITKIIRYALCLLALLAVILLPELLPHAQASGHDMSVASSGDAIRLMRLSHHNS